MLIHRKVLVIVGVLEISWTAFAWEVNMNNNVLPPQALGSISPSGTGATNDPYTYTFSTTNGLNMGTYKIYGNQQNNKNVCLNLNGGSITGSPSATAFEMICTASANYPADVVITNVANVRLGKILTYINVGNFNHPARDAGSVTIGWDIPGGRAGTVEVTEIDTSDRADYSGSGTGKYAGAVRIYSIGDVKIWDGATAGDIKAYGLMRSSLAGSVIIKHDGSFIANLVRTDVDRTWAGTILLDGDALGNGASGDCFVNGLMAHNRAQGGESGGGGNITVQNYIDVSVNGDVLSYGGPYGYGGNAGHVVLTAMNNIVVTGSIRAHSPAANYPGVAGNVTICSSNGTIKVDGNIDAYATNHSGSVAGTVTLFSAGDIRIGGMINTDGGVNANERDVVVSNWNGDAVIYLGALDMNKARIVRLIPGGKNSYITNSILNFATNRISGSGTLVDPYITVQTDLRTPVGKKIYYESSSLENAYLGGYTYKVADLNGNAGQGGILTPRRPTGIVIFFW